MTSDPATVFVWVWLPIRDDWDEVTGGQVNGR